MTIPVTNTHVHFPPNFSAYETVDEAVQAAVSQNVAAMGISNFYDQSVYRAFTEAAKGAGIVPLYGLEFITLDPALEAQGIRVNDPANPGRMYLCGKGISPFKEKTVEAAHIAESIRTGNDARSAAQVQQLAAWFTECGIANELSVESIAQAVAQRAGVPVKWVSLQERHIARACEESLSHFNAEDKRAALAKLYGQPSGVDVNDPVALQGEIRSRLLKAGTPGFAPEVPLSFEQAYAYIVAMDGIPVYPTLADGVSPVCEFEADPDQLARELLKRGIYAAELIPIRNHVAVVDEYVKAFTDAGLIVMAGTEHNTVDKIALDPACVDGPASDYAKQAFWEASCVIAAHQALVQQGKSGFVDEGGNRTDVGKEDLIAYGAALIEGKE